MPNPPDRGGNLGKTQDKKLTEVKKMPVFVVPAAPSFAARVVRPRGPYTGKTARMASLSSASALANMIADHAQLVDALRAMQAGKPESEWKTVLESFTDADGVLALWTVDSIRCEGCGKWRLDLKQDESGVCYCTTCTRKRPRRRMGRV